jgi:hypothetical protein
MDNQDNFDGFSAFSCRRKIFLEVQEIQKAEHNAINRIGKIIESKKETILIIFADFLVEYKERGEHHWEINNISGCNMDDWIELQSESEKLATQLNTARIAKEKASEAYYKMAPFGLVTEIFSDPAKKVEITQLSDFSKLKDREYNTIQGFVNTNDRKRKDFGKKFMRGCLEHISSLRLTNVFGDKCQIIISEMTEGIGIEWSAYIQKQHVYLSSLDMSLESLKSTYGIQE